MTWLDVVFVVPWTLMLYSAQFNGGEWPWNPNPEDAITLDPFPVKIAEQPEAPARRWRWDTDLPGIEWSD